jgi:hypothetical protein
MTAIEWLLENSHIIPKNELNKRELIKQAKEMEKQQIIGAFYDGCFDTNSWRAEEYYNETFNK